MLGALVQIEPWLAEPTLVFAVCSSKSDAVPRAPVSVTRATFEVVFEPRPRGSECHDCAQVVLEAHRPQTLDWDAAMSGPAMREGVSDHAQRRRGAPGICTPEVSQYHYAVQLNIAGRC